MLVLNEFGLICKWRAVYIERCKHGSGASIRKPAVVTWQGAECLAYLDVTGSTGLFGAGEQIAQEICATIKTELGVTVSVGVS
jgi:hypothetical protein